MRNIYKHAFTFGTTRGSNPGPFDPKSDTLATTPTPPPIHAVQGTVDSGYLRHWEIAVTLLSDAECWVHSGSVAWPAYKPISKV